MSILNRIKGLKELVLKKSKELNDIAEIIYEDPSISSDKKTELIINATALACGIVAAQPIPFADIFILTPIQVIMITYISKIYGINTTDTTAKEILVYLVSVLGFGVLSQHTILGLYKTIIPFAGAITTIPLVYTATYILGKCATVVINSKINGIEVSKEMIKEIKKRESEKLKQEDFNLTGDELKNQLNNLKRKDYKKYKEILQKFDEKITSDAFDIEIIINKRNILSERFSIYKNFQIKESALDVLIYMSANEIHKVEKLISKLSRNEIKMDKENTVYDFGNIFKVKIGIHELNYILEYIVHSNQMIMELSNRKSNNEEKVLHNEEIRKQFLQSFNDVKNVLCISSPWLSYSVIDAKFIEKIECLLRRGVEIKIRYGIGEINNKNDCRNRTTDKLAHELKSRFVNYKNLKMLRTNSHSKILICDNSYYMVGSYNYLSFSGKYDGEDLREEEAIYSTNKNIIENLYKKFQF